MIYIDELDFIDELIEVYGGDVSLSQVKSFVEEKIENEE